MTIAETTSDELAALIAAATDAAPELDRLGPAARADLLVAVADALDAESKSLVAVADEETHLGETRLSGEVGRTTFQLRLFADVLREGAYLEAIVDHADPEWPPGPRPDLRRMLVPLGPALVFAASNFPFAFSVAGGDTASALAAGCPVLLKVHSGHPRLSQATGEVVRDALDGAGAPAGSFGLIFGHSVGAAALVDQRIKVGSFTGSLDGGRALFNLASGRPEPIPFYGELGSLNPVFVTAAAIAARGAAIAEGYVNSFNLGVGQFCTKPGVLLVPGANALEDLAAELAAKRPGATMLNERLAGAYRATLEALSATPGVRVVVPGGVDVSGAVAPTLLATTVGAALERPEAILAECFGPTSVLIAYGGDDELLAAARHLPGQLTATVHGEGDEAVVPELIATLTGVAGRVIWNGWPTGVAVTYAMHHGGPFPATTVPLHTSVGTTAIGRFLRPVAYQDLPDALLPLALREANPLGIPRRVDGRFAPGAGAKR